MKIITVSLILIISFMFASFVEGATLYFVPPSETIYRGDIFPIEVRIDSSEASINAVEANIDFSSDILWIESIEKTNSILNLWPKEPSFTNAFGLASLLGGLPDPGFQNDNGLIGILYFQAKNEGVGSLSFKNTSRVLLNDGLGSEALLELKDISLIIAKQPEGYEPKVGVIAPDTIPPDSFIPIISRSEYVFDGKYFVAFVTQDHESGISHYEVQEKVGIKWGEWKITVSPHLLETQEGEVTVFVKAVDKAGNETIGMAEVTIPKKKLSPIYIIAIPLIILLGLIIWKIIQYVLKRKHDEKTII